MLSAAPYARLPDPDFQAEFYRDVPAKRLFAWAIDTVVVAVMVALIVPLTAFVALFFLPLLFLTLNFLYRWVTLSSGSATWGMRLAAIEFRRIDGTRFDAITAFLHTLGYTLSISSVLPQLVSVVLMATGPRAQGLSDLVLGTVAINRAGRR
ncbi:MAG: RDD family protein [Rhodobacteraceae bacterium]|nr:RDD family protein [Paracoccaceae bacterium]